MVEIDGIEIKEITSIKCNSDTGWETHIEFYIDKRLNGTTDIKQLSDYEVNVYKSDDPDHIDYARLIFPNEDNYQIKFINTDK